MTTDSGLLALIPARGGSKGLKGKNILPFQGLPLIAHSILFAQMCPEIERTVVSTDSSEIAGVARKFGAEVPFIRPAELAADDTPIWPVIRHALATIEAGERRRYRYVVLLDPTSPAREGHDVSLALEMIEANPATDGVVAVSRPKFSPLWHAVIARDGWMCDLAEGARWDRRQDVPEVYVINGALYLWRSPFVRSEERSWRRHGKHLMYEIPDLRAMSIDDAEDFARAEALVRSGLIAFPWLTGRPSP